MNRDELLATIGVDDYRPGDKVIEATDGADVLAHADVYWRRVLLIPPTPRGGNSITVAGEVVPVARLANLCYDQPPDEVPRDWEADLVAAVRVELAEHSLIRWVCTLADPAGRLDRLGFYHPPGHPDPAFVVLDLRGETWPDGTVELTGDWK